MREISPELFQMILEVISDMEPKKMGHWWKANKCLEQMLAVDAKARAEAAKAEEVKTKAE